MGARFNDVGHGKIEGRKLDPREIIIREGWNYRDMSRPEVREHIDWLKESIKQEGVTQPIRIKYVQGEVHLLDGECRVRACRELFDEGVTVPYRDGTSGPPLVPAIGVESNNEGDWLATSMIANGAMPPTKLEFGQAADRLMKLGWSAERLVAYIPSYVSGKQPSQAVRWVNEAVELHRAPEPVKAAMRDGVDGVVLSEAAALKVARENPIEAERVIHEAVSEAKQHGKTVVSRPKGAGVATKAKVENEGNYKKWIELADAMMRIALDPHLDISEVEIAARAYKKARGL